MGVLDKLWTPIHARKAWWAKAVDPRLYKLERTAVCAPQEGRPVVTGAGTGHGSKACDTLKRPRCHVA